MFKRVIYTLFVISLLFFSHIGIASLVNHPEVKEIVYTKKQEPQPEYVEPPKTGINQTENHTSILMLIVTFIISLFGIRLETKNN